MTSILTNQSATAALQTLRHIAGSMSETQRQVSSGLRVGQASDNAAYWSIATTMSSDNMALSAVQDALGLGAAKVDTAYAGMTGVVDVLKEFKAKLVAATEEGVDKRKIQEELEQLKQQVVSISEGASFSGQNWLSTDVSDLESGGSASVVASFVRGEDRSVRVEKKYVNLAKLSLFNVGGGGMLDGPSSQVSLPLPDTTALSISQSLIGGYSRQEFAFSGPSTLSTGDQISFDILVDSSVYSSGTSYAVMIDRAVVDSALGTSDGLIGTAEDWVKVVNKGLDVAGALAFARARTPLFSGSTSFDLVSLGTSGAIGSSVNVSNLASSLSGYAFGLENPPTDNSNNLYPQGGMATFEGNLTLEEERGVSQALFISAGFGYGTQPSYVISQDTINEALGVNTGTVNSSVDFARVLNYATEGSGLVFFDLGYLNNIWVRQDPSLNPTQGINVIINIGPLATGFANADTAFGLLEVDIVNQHRPLDIYIAGLDEMVQEVTSASAYLGAISSGIEMQTEFVAALSDSIDSGVGRLVDADLNEASTRLKALQTQEQLAIQSLSIANSSADNVLTLFRQ